ncbi:MAG: universal stress protein [Polyangiales bacterium]|nr:universal stress protein [Myxococcales bacterium]
MQADPTPYRILVAIDFSDTSRHAFHEAIRIAAHSKDVELHMVNVIADTHANRGDNLAKDNDRMSDSFDRMRTMFEAKGGAAGDSNGKRAVKVGFHVRLGNPSDAILQAAVDVNADIIVVGSHGRSVVGRALFGSVSQALVEAARVPVLVARPKDFEGLSPSPRMDPPRPGADADHAHMYSEIPLPLGRRDLHVSGLL